ncbi:RDD family protein [Goodfellowiella coeruleoviolacea]|uniref:RDD family protein n=1 Tax=Goodfellowiella coeruleoviolacea TaxID=334858 RepID=A0AAE3GGM1_9PSEU|nr:RDD family protein [Goodfellowiella coeruleoviolacea]MCP2167891.1 RDD family protein [Goodfellowiella coeruleoviolacea]
MTRWTGSWLSGPRSALEPGENAGDRPQQRWRGERLGLPESGPGSVSSTGRRAWALLIDVFLAAGVAGLFTYPELPRNWSLLAWFVITVVAVAFFGFTPGMAALGLRVARIDNKVMVGLPHAVLRAVLVGLIIPAVVWDADNRGLHDKACRTVVLRTR